MSNIERYLTTWKAQEAPLGSGTPEITDLNTELALLDTDTRERTKDLFDFVTAVAPSSLSLVASVKGEDILKRSGDCVFEFKTTTHPCQPVTLKSLSMPSVLNLVGSCYASVTLEWTGTGHQKTPKGEWEDLIYGVDEIPKLLFTKEFPLPAPVTKQGEKLLSAGEWEVTCSAWTGARLNERPIIPLGGYFDKSLNLDRFIPMFATLSGSADAQTVLMVKSQAYWHSKGIFPGTSGSVGNSKYSFLDSVASKATTSLGEDIRAGRLSFALEDGISYVSQGFETWDPQAGLVLIHFKKQKTT